MLRDWPKILQQQIYLRYLLFIKHFLDLKTDRTDSCELWDKNLHKNFYKNATRDLITVAIRHII